MRFCAAFRLVCVCSFWVVAASALHAQSQTDALMKLLRGGQVPPERLGNLVDLICQRGGPEELAYVFERSLSDDGFVPAVRAKAWESLAAAAQTRKLKPQTDLAQLKRLIGSDNEAARRAGVRLAGLWQVESLVGPLQELVLADSTESTLRAAAMESLWRIGGERVEQTVQKLLAADDVERNGLGLAVLARTDLPAAVAAALDLLRGRAREEPGKVLDAFLTQRGGPDALAAALRDRPPAADVAKRALRHMYSVGHSDPVLVEVLTKAAGISAQPIQLSPEQMRELIDAVAKRGDAVRGEGVFRRADLSCMKCHSVSGAGGDIGPDLSPVGGVSPVDYLINSVLNPDLAIKENFVTRQFLTSDGLIVQGIVQERDDRRVVIKTAAGERVTLATADIDDEAEGKSLMPKGLAGFMTQDELIDLVRFLSELGRPGPYAVRAEPTIQRYRLLAQTPSNLTVGVPDAAAFSARVLSAGPEQWLSVYAKVAGELPLDECAAPERQVLYLQGAVEATAAGKVEVQLNDPAGTNVWFNDRPLDASKPLEVELTPGTHIVTFRVDLAQRKNRALRVVIAKPTGSTAEYAVVGGK